MLTSHIDATKSIALRDHLCRLIILRVDWLLFVKHKATAVYDSRFYDITSREMAYLSHALTIIFLIRF